LRGIAGEGVTVDATGVVAETVLIGIGPLAAFVREQIGIVARSVVASVVAVSVRPLRGVVREGIACVGVPVAVPVGAAQPVEGGGASRGGAIVSVVACGVAAEAVVVFVAPLGRIVGERIGPEAIGRWAPTRRGVGVAVTVGVGAPQAVVLRGPRLIRAGIGPIAVLIVAVTVAVGVHVLGSVQREGIGHTGIGHQCTGPFSGTVGRPGSVGVVVAPSVTVGVVPLGGIVGERIAALVDVELVGIDFVQVVVAPPVAVTVGPLSSIGRECIGPICCLPDARNRVGIAVTVGVQTSEPIVGGGASNGHAGIRLIGRSGVVAVTVTVGIVPLGAVVGEGVNNTVALIGRVVPVVVGVKIGEEELNALVVPTHRRHQVKAIGMPGHAVDVAAGVAVARLRAGAGTASELYAVHQEAVAGLINQHRTPVGTVVADAEGHLLAVG